MCTTAMRRGRGGLAVIYLWFSLLPVGLLTAQTLNGSLSTTQATSQTTGKSLNVLIDVNIPDSCR